MAKKPARQYSSWAMRVHLRTELVVKAEQLRGILIQDESGQAVAIDELHKWLEQLRKLLDRERQHPGIRRKIEGELAEIVDGVKPMLDKLRRNARGRMPLARELAGEIVDLLELLGGRQ
jgi:hypothetical protein